MLVVISMAKPREAAVRRWTMTLNNPTDDELPIIISNLRKRTSYAILGKEIAPTTNTPHLQGFFVTNKRTRLRGLKIQISSRAHFEPARTTVVNNIAYCKKEGNVLLEHGVVPGGGAGGSSKVAPKSRYVIAKEFKDRLDNSRHAGICDFADRYPDVWFFNGRTMLDSWLKAHEEIERPEMKVSWFHGKTGTGKSVWAKHLLPGAYYKDSCTKWWDGYMFEPSCIIDSLAPKHIDINHLLKWFDKYPNKVETKGGMIPLHVMEFIITSNFSPQECYYDEPQLPALLRRITEIKEFKKDETQMLLTQVLVNKAIGQ
jgi:hypothetical protein